MAKLEKIIHINQEDFTSLVSNGSITLGGTTYTYDSTGATEYIIDSDAVPAYATTSGYANSAGIATVADDISSWNVAGAYIIRCDSSAATSAKAGQSKTLFTPTLDGSAYLVFFENANTYSGQMTCKFNGVPATANAMYIDGVISSSSNKTIPSGLYFADYMTIDGAGHWNIHTNTLPNAVASSAQVNFNVSDNYAFKSVSNANDSNATFITAATGTATADSNTDTLTVKAGNKWIVTRVTDNSNSDSLEIAHARALADGSEGSFGPSADASLSHEGTFTVPYITVDKAGHITAVSNKTMTLPSDSNTDEKVKVNASTSTTSSQGYPILTTTSVSPTTGSTSESNYFVKVGADASGIILHNGGGTGDTGSIKFRRGSASDANEDWLMYARAGTGSASATSVFTLQSSSGNTNTEAVTVDFTTFNNNAVPRLSSHGVVWASEGFMIDGYSNTDFVMANGGTSVIGDHFSTTDATHMNRGGPPWVLLFSRI